MENKKHDHSLQILSQASKNKQMNEDIDSSNTVNLVEETHHNHNAQSGNNSTNKILQKEKLLDPGNEHKDDTLESGLNKKDNPETLPAEGDAIDDGQKPE